MLKRIIYLIKRLIWGPEKISVILREAAENIDNFEQEFSCVAIAYAHESWPYLAKAYYEKLMSEDEDCRMQVTQFTHDGLDGLTGHCNYPSPQESRDLRVLALLMAAEVAESEGL